jgi:hypothetical protein
MNRRFLRAAVCAMAATLALGACAYLPLPARAGSEPTAEQVAAFGPMAALVGRTWRSQPAGEGQTGPADIARWSWDLGGRVIVTRHALEDGSYGGITHIYENGQTGSLDYVYVTSGGFHTTGSYVLSEDGSWTAEEAVTGHDTITRVRSKGRIMPDGRMAMTSDYFAKGEWQPGRNVVYVPTDLDVPEITGTLAK